MVETLLKLSKTMMDILVRDLTKYSLTTHQFFLLSFLRDLNRPLPMNEIALFMQHSTAATTGMIDRMQVLGLLKRKPTRKDRRVMLVCVTEKGTRVLGELNKKMESISAQMLSLLTPEERTAWISINQKILSLSDQDPPKFDGMKNLSED